MKIIETNLQFKGALLPRASTRRIVVHHTASGDVSAATIHRWHLDRGWQGIGYHYIIRANGHIERGRPEHVRGVHASDANADSIGIVLTGDFTKTRPTVAQLDSLVALVRDIRARHGDIPVVGHRDVDATQCPGPMFPWSELEQMLKGSGDRVTILFNGRRTTVPARLVDGRTQVQLDGHWVQLRALVEMIPGAKIDWNPATRTVGVLVPGKEG